MAGRGLQWDQSNLVGWPPDRAGQGIHVPISPWRGGYPLLLALLSRPVWGRERRNTCKVGRRRDEWRFRSALTRVSIVLVLCGQQNLAGEGETPEGPSYIAGAGPKGKCGALATFDCDCGADEFKLQIIAQIFIHRLMLS